MVNMSKHSREGEKLARCDRQRSADRRTARRRWGLGDGGEMQMRRRRRAFVTFKATDMQSYRIGVFIQRV